MLLLAGCSRPDPPPGPTADELRALAPAATVTVEGPANPRRRIIQLDDLHWISWEDFAADLRDQDPDVTEDDIDAAYSDLMAKVDVVQAEQVAVLQAMAEQHATRAVHREGLTEGNTSGFARMVATVRQYRPTVESGDGATGMLAGELFSDDLRRIGAAGQLLADGVLTEVLPADDAAAMEAANPVSDDGTVSIDQTAQEAREAAMVELLLSDGQRLAVVIVGAAHDLADHLPADVEYIRVRVPAVD